MNKHSHTKYTYSYVYTDTLGCSNKRRTMVVRNRTTTQYSQEITQHSTEQRHIFTSTHTAIFIIFVVDRERTNQKIQNEISIRQTERTKLRFAAASWSAHTRSDRLCLTIARSERKSQTCEYNFSVGLCTPVSLASVHRVQSELWYIQRNTLHGASTTRIYIILVLWYRRNILYIVYVRRCTGRQADTHRYYSM